MTGASEAVFITGGSGLLALNWAISQRHAQSVTLGLHQRVVTLPGIETHRCALDTVDEVARALDVVRPALVVHAAGLTNIESCEAHPDLAQHVNVGLSVNVATACAERGVGLVHVSTDHLFSGEAAMVDESHPVAPRNVYGRTKAEAERRVLDCHPGALVVRTNFFGWGTTYRRSFSDTVIHALRAGKPVTLFTDVLFTPTLVDVLVQAVLDLVALRTSGIVHVGGDQRLSKYECGLQLARHFALDAELVRPGLLADARHLVPRPRDMSLSNLAARRLLGRALGDVKHYAVELRRQEQTGRAQELQHL